MRRLSISITAPNQLVESCVRAIKPGIHTRFKRVESKVHGAIQVEEQGRIGEYANKGNRNQNVN